MRSKSLELNLRDRAGTIMARLRKIGGMATEEHNRKILVLAKNRCRLRATFEVDGDGGDEGGYRHRIRAVAGGSWGRLLAITSELGCADIVHTCPSIPTSEHICHAVRRPG